MALVAIKMTATDIERIHRVREQLPKEGLFAGKEWLTSPEPFRVDHRFAEQLEKLGHWLWKFIRASNLLYYQSKKGKRPAWIADALDAGKPKELLELAIGFRQELPRVIRPDLILTEKGFVMSELDSVPGGIGLTAWLSRTYAQLGFDVIGGAAGMLDGFEAILPEGVIAVSDESETYRPEMRWLRDQLVQRSGEKWQVVRAENWDFGSPSNVYRFFELFDLPNLPSCGSLFAAARNGTLRLTPPLKPFIEEKMWSALFWMRPLQEFWRRELSERHWLKLRQLIPQTWLLDPTAIPHHAVIPGLGIQNWEELKQFSQKQREFVLKVSGFSEKAWGSRGVYVGPDLPHQEWANRIDGALASFHSNPFILQRFARGRLFQQPFWNEQTQSIESLRGRVRLCPYYFVLSDHEVKLGGALATIVPPDKKLVHGMRDAIMVPTAVG
jgi:hypothetical protein